MFIFGCRCYNNVEFFHNIEWVPIDPTGGVESYGHERVGRRVYVFHLRIAAWVRMRELRRQKTTFTQRGLQTWGESGHSGEYSLE